MIPAPVDWRAMIAWTRAADTEWLSTGTSVLLEVPSVIVPFGKNYLVNPLHSDASHLHVAEVLDVQHDPRIHEAHGSRIATADGLKSTERVKTLDERLCRGTQRVIGVVEVRNCSNA